MSNADIPFPLYHNRWNAAFIGLPLDSADEINDFIKTAGPHSVTFSQADTHKHRHVALSFPPEISGEPVAPLAILFQCRADLKDGRAENLALADFYPVPLYGSLHEALVTDIRLATDDQAILELEFPDGHQFPAMSRYWPADREHIRIGDKGFLRIAALATCVEDIPTKEHHIKSGPFFEMARDEFLAENPDKTAADFPYATLHMQGASVILPCGDKFPDESEIAAAVIERQEFSFLGGSKLRLDIKLRFDGDDTRVPLYIPTPATGDYNPAPGDDLTAFVRFIAWPEPRT